MQSRRAIGLFAIVLGCGGAGGGYLAGAPRERDLPEPVVDESALRPAVFGYGGTSTRLAVNGCDLPLEYALGELDPRFGLGRKQALKAIATAVGYWEQSAGRPLLRYSPRSAFTIDFVFDERQEMLIKRRTGRDPLAQVRRRYDALEAEHDRALAAYEADRQRYQATVAEWNQQGGAPTETKRALDGEKRRLTAERARVDAMLPRIAALAADINSRGRNLGESDMRHLIAGYTDRTTHNGVTIGIDIDIFMFETWQQLPLILAHELGHSLGLEHVATRGSLMYGGPNPQRQPRASAADLAELRRVCR